MEGTIAGPKETMVDVSLFTSDPAGGRPRPATVTGWSAEGVRLVTSQAYPEGAQVCVRLREPGDSPPGSPEGGLHSLALGQVRHSRPVADAPLPSYEIDVRYHRF